MEQVADARARDACACSATPPGGKSIRSQRTIHSANGSSCDRSREERAVGLALVVRRAARRARARRRSPHRSAPRRRDVVDDAVPADRLDAGLELVEGEPHRRDGRDSTAAHVRPWSSRRRLIATRPAGNEPAMAASAKRTPRCYGSCARASRVSGSRACAASQWKYWPPSITIVWPVTKRGRRAREVDDGADDVLGLLVALDRARGDRDVAQLLDHLGVLPRPRPTS